MVLGGGGLVALGERDVHGYGEGLLWALSLMTTVGFVGGRPHTVPGKVIAAGLMLSGFTLLALTTASISSLFVKDDLEPQEKRELTYEDELLGTAWYSRSSTISRRESSNAEAHPTGKRCSGPGSELTLPAARATCKTSWQSVHR